MKNSVYVYIFFILFFSSCVSMKKYNSLKTVLNDQKTNSEKQALKIKSFEHESIAMKQEKDLMSFQMDSLSRKILTLENALSTLNDSLIAKRGEQNEYYIKYHNLLKDMNNEKSRSTQNLIEKEKILAETKKVLTAEKAKYHKSLSNLLIMKHLKMVELKNACNDAIKKLKQSNNQLASKNAQLKSQRAILLNQHKAKQEEVNRLIDKIDSLENFIQRSYLGEVKQKLNTYLTKDEKTNTNISIKEGQLMISFKDSFLFSDKKARLVSPQGQIVLAKIAKFFEKDKNVKIAVINENDQFNQTQALTSSVGDILIRNGINRLESSAVVLNRNKPNSNTTAVVLEMQ